jgi:hypothetical protein
LICSGVFHVFIDAYDAWQICSGAFDQQVGSRLIEMAWARRHVLEDQRVPVRQFQPQTQTFQLSFKRRFESGSVDHRCTVRLLAALLPAGAQKVLGVVPGQCAPDGLVARRQQAISFGAKLCEIAGVSATIAASRAELFVVESMKCAHFFISLTKLIGLRVELPGDEHREG